MLNQALILVAEDEPFIALDVSLAIEDAGGQVAGPVASVQEALALIGSTPVVAAILDHNLTDGDSSPVVERLLLAGIPTILQSGVSLPGDLASRFPQLVVHIKPCNSARLVAQIAVLITNNRLAPGETPSPLP